MTRLPQVLVQLIFQCLDLSSLLRFGRVSKQFYQIADTDPPWKVPVGPVGGPLKRRLIILDSSHTKRLLHGSLLQRHASISWDLAHDESIDRMIPHFVSYWWDVPEKFDHELEAYCRVKSPDRQVKLIYDIKSEIEAICQPDLHLNTLVISGDADTSGFALEGLFQSLTTKNCLQTLVMTTDSQPILVLEESVFDCMISIHSLTKLSYSSALYTTGQIALLSTLPSLQSLRLQIQPSGSEYRPFNHNDLLTLGHCTQLTDLFLEDDWYGSMFNAEFCGRFFQQPNLKYHLRSVTLAKFPGTWQAHHLRTAFEGYQHLTSLTVFRDSCPNNWETLQGEFLAALTSTDKATGAAFLPALTRLQFVDPFVYTLPPLSTLVAFLSARRTIHFTLHFRPHLGDIDIDLHEPMRATFSDLSRQYPSQFTFIELSVDRRDDRSAAHPRRCLKETMTVMYPLNRLNWLENDAPSAEHVRTALGDFDYRIMRPRPPAPVNEVSEATIQFFANHEQID